MTPEDKELVRKYAWCQFMAAAMMFDCNADREKVTKAADTALAEYDKRWPKESV